MLKIRQLIIDNKIEKTLSGPPVFIGFASLVFGFVSIISAFWVTGAVAIIVAWFLLLSYSGIQIDSAKRVVKPYNCWFSIFKTGKWKTLDNFVGLTLVPMKKVYTVYSRSNRTMTSKKDEFRIYLVNKSKKPVLAIKNCKERETAQNSMDEFAIWLKLPVFTIKH